MRHRSYGAGRMRALPRPLALSGSQQDARVFWSCEPCGPIPALAYVHFLGIDGGL